MGKKVRFDGIILTFLAVFCRILIHKCNKTTKIPHQIDYFNDFLGDLPQRLPQPYPYP